MVWFPINSRHQEVATKAAGKVLRLAGVLRFQSIAATKKWRRSRLPRAGQPVHLCFQSIAATKKWRLGAVLLCQRLEIGSVSNQ